MSEDHKSKTPKHTELPYVATLPWMHHINQEEKVDSTWSKMSFGNTREDSRILSIS
jgi:hypothetical protein